MKRMKEVCVALYDCSRGNLICLPAHRFHCLQKSAQYQQQQWDDGEVEHENLWNCERLLIIHRGFHNGQLSPKIIWKKNNTEDD